MKDEFYESTIQSIDGTDNPLVLALQQLEREYDGVTALSRKLGMTCEGVYKIARTGRTSLDTTLLINRLTDNRFSIEELLSKRAPKDD